MWKDVEALTAWKDVRSHLRSRLILSSVSPQATRQEREDSASLGSKKSSRVDAFGGTTSAALRAGSTQTLPSTWERCVGWGRGVWDGGEAFGMEQA